MKRFSSHGRSEWLIASGRVALAAFSLLAVRLDPSEPASYAQIARALLSAYVAYSLLIFGLLWARRTLPRWWKLGTQALDLGAFLALMFFTHGSNSPFVYFTFSLASATMRWQWRGTLWTAAVAIPAFLATGFYASQVLHHSNFDPNRLIVRSAYLAVVAIMLGHLGTYRERLRTERSRLAAWPRTEPGEVLASVRQLLENAAGILQAPRMLMIWEEAEESAVRLACLSEGKLDFGDESAGTFGSLVVEALSGRDFL